MSNTTIIGTYSYGDEIGWCPQCSSTNSSRLGRMVFSGGIQKDVIKCNNCNTLFEGGTGSISLYTTTNNAGFITLDNSIDNNATTKILSNIDYILLDIKNILSNIEIRLCNIVVENNELKKSYFSNLKQTIDSFSLK